MKAIEVNNFYKSFEKNKIINWIDFFVNKGEIFAYLGTNWSGKTTTIRSLLNIYSPDSWTLKINWKNTTEIDTSQIGYLPEERGLYLDMTVAEIMEYFGRLKKLSKNKAKQNWLKYLEKVGLENKRNLNIKQLSSGQQQKIQLWICIINSPEILILDEPWKWLDPLNRKLFIDLFLELKKIWTTILFSSHQMEDVEKVCDSLLILKDWKSKAFGNIQDVKKSFGKNTIKLYYQGELPKETNLFAANIEWNYAEIIPKNNSCSNSIIDYLINNNIKILNFEYSYPSLNEIFINIFKNN